MITEVLVIRRRSATTTALRTGTDSAVDATPAVRLFDFVRNNVDPEIYPGLARGLAVLADEKRIPQTIQALARRADTSVSTLWREWRAFGLPHPISLLVLVGAALVWRSAAERSHTPIQLEAVHVTPAAYLAAVRLVSERLERAGTLAPVVFHEHGGGKRERETTTLTQAETNWQLFETISVLPFLHRPFKLASACRRRWRDPL